MYEEMTYEAIQAEMLDKTGDKLDKREGSVIWDATAPVSFRLAEMYFQLANYSDLIFPDTSAEKYLERFADPFGIERKTATNSLRKVTAVSQLEKGSRWQIEDATYVIVERMGDGTYTAQCEQPGIIGNQYFGELHALNNGVDKTVELGEVITSGTEEETDDALRDRLLKKIQQPAAGGNANDYYNWAMSCAGVGAARIFPLADGPGTVTVVLADEHGRPVENATAKEVSEYIEGRRPIGADVTVVPAIEKQVNVTARIKLAAGYNLGYVQDAYLFSVDGYLRQRALGLNYVSLARLGNLLLAVDGVEDYSGFIINGATENLAVLPGEIAVAGTIRLEVG